jgi:hypothetical protein
LKPLDFMATIPKKSTTSSHKLGGDVRASPVSRETGTAGTGTMRNRSEPDQVTQVGFDLE